MACNSCNESIDLCQCDPGKNSFSITTANFSMPAEGGTVTVNVSNVGQYTGKWGAFGQVVFVSKLLGGSGYFGVASTTSTTMTLVNIKDTGTGAYATNPAPGTVFTSGANVSPSGLQGLTGLAGTDGKELIDINYTNRSNSGAITQVYTVSLGTGLYLQNVGDSIEIECIFFNSVPYPVGSAYSSTNDAQFNIVLNEGATYLDTIDDITPGDPGLTNIASQSGVRLLMTITRNANSFSSKIEKQYGYGLNISSTPSLTLIYAGGSGGLDDIHSLYKNYGAGFNVANPMNILVYTTAAPSGAVPIILTYSKVTANNKI